jgi:WD40-like Beta Propeller Repeat
MVVAGSSDDVSRELHRGRGDGLRVLVTLACLLAAGMLASALTAGPAAAAERLVFQSNDGPFGPYNLDFADPVGGAAQRFVTAMDTYGVQDPTWSHDDKRISFYEYSNSAKPGRGVVSKPASGGAETTLLPGSAQRPSWSPVAGEIAYWENSFPKYTLKVATTDGRTTRTLAGPYDIRTDFAGSEPEQPGWSADGKTIAFFVRRGISIVPAVGGAPRLLVAGGAAQTHLVHAPSFAPDRRHLAYVKHFDNDPAGFPWQLVVRDLRNAQERVVAGGDAGVLHGPQSWSPDSSQLAFGEYRLLPGNPPTREGTLNVVKRDGTGRRNLLRRENYIGAPAWGSGGPNYFVKHVEVTQAISPDLGALDMFDPMLPDEYTIHRAEAKAFGFRIPLIADKSTLLRVYIGDSTLAAGATERRSLRVSVIDEGTSTEYGPPAAREVDVTAKDVVPRQDAERAAVNVWVPPEAARPGGTNRFKVEVNVGQEEPECPGCYPNGNRATVQDIRHEEGGSIVVAPVPIYLITPDSGTVLKPNVDALTSAVSEATLMLPVRDDGVTLTPSPGALLVEQKELTHDDGCSVLVEKLLVLRATGGIAGPVEGFGATRWVGYAPPVVPPAGAAACAGKADSTPGRNLVLLGPRPAVFAHELGHTLGLTHATGRNQSLVPAGAIPLPYAGIGGVGTQPGAGGVTEMFSSAAVGDLMSYDVDTWTSPKTWEFMYGRILAESGAIQPQATTARARVSAKKPWVRRVVSGVLRGTDTTIHSLVATAASPAVSGPSAARVVARNARGKVVARAAIRGVPQRSAGESAATLPFLVTLPARKRIVSLQVLPRRGGKPLARLRASRHAPKGRFLKLPRRARAKKTLTVRWTASDRDRRDALSVQVLARRAKSGWRSLALAPAKGSLAVPPSRLGTGKRLRLRLRISDGFRTTVVDARKIVLTTSRPR